MQSNAPIAGGCNCGKVRYALNAQPLAVAACHCQNCQRQSGAAFSVNLVMSADAVAVQGELACYVDPDSESGNPVERYFCDGCGSPIKSVPTATPKIVAIKAGTLDDPSPFAPGLHMWTCSALPWVDIPNDIPRYDRGIKR